MYGRMFNMNRSGFLIVFILSALVPSLTPAATGRILDEVEAQQADTAALAAEAELFKSIGLGIALSLSQCAEQSSCTPSVSKDELSHLLDTLDKRINDLVSRQEQKQGDYNEVLTAYVNQRENYLRYQAELDKISGGASSEEDLGKDSFGETGPSTGTEAATPKTAPTETATVKKSKAPAKKSGGSEAEQDVFSDTEKPLE